MQLDLSPPRCLPDDVAFTARARRATEEARTAEEGHGGRRGGPEVPALRHGQDAAVADRAHGPEDPVQRVRREVQVGPAGAGVQARGEPDVCADEALELAPQGAGAAAPEGADAGPAAAAAASSSSSKHDVRCLVIQRRRVLDPSTCGPGFRAADLVWC